MDEQKKYAFAVLIFALVQQQRYRMLLLLARRRKRKRETFIFGCHPVYEAPPPRPRFYVKRRPRRGGPVDEDGRQLYGNKAWFRHWAAESTYSEYLNLMPPSVYEPAPVNEVVRRQEFERKIRLPYETFFSLYLRMKDDPLMQERSTAVPLKLKLIAALRYLALGAPWDACEDIFNVDKRTLRDFFYRKFVPFMLRIYPEHVSYPITQEALAELMAPYELAGFPGCIGCVDGMHVSFAGYRSGRRFMFADHHQNFSLGFNFTCDDYGRIIHVSDWMPGSMNDKTKIQSDHFQCVVMRTEPLYTRQRSAVRVGGDAYSAIQGVYCLSDDGYHRWPTTVSAFKRPTPGTWAAKWTRWHESLRKEIECCFGRMKKKFRILAVPMMRRNEIDCANIVKVCACLHNMAFQGTVAADRNVDWRQVDEIDLEHVYGPDFDAEAFTIGPESQRTVQGSPLMSQTRADLTQHFKFQFAALKRTHGLEHEVLGDIERM